MKNEWQTDRGQLNHNWLQNGVLVALNHAERIASDGVRSSVVRQTLAEDIQRWDERRIELPAFLDRFENEMSPKVFFERAPLCRCSAETKQWLIPLTHELWLGREKVQEKMAAAKQAYETAEQKYEVVHADLESMPETPTMEDLQPFERVLREFTTACESLSKAISAFPHEIRCC
ncbi:MAG: hypothetical protein JJU29_01735 [Verrucomicrobia bacterium]|nr:hypothetical protein [Verrucomicrobiota bacterium]MCH8510954.1 hypothetical protein [Kiritimatiellia bacterium]